MTKTSDTDRESVAPRNTAEAMIALEINAWFVREVLPLEAALLQFLRRNRRNESELEDLCHDIYVRVYESARKEIPHPAKPFVFTVARNLLISRARHEHVIPIEAVADLGALGIAVDEPGPDRIAFARQELHRLQLALDRLPPRCREVVIMRRIEGLSRSEIAARMNIVESTVSEYLATGIDILTNLVLGETNEQWRKS